MKLTSVLTEPADLPMTLRTPGYRELVEEVRRARVRHRPVYLAAETLQALLEDLDAMDAQIVRLRRERH